MKIHVLLFILCGLGCQMLMAQLPDGITTADSIAFARSTYNTDSLPPVQDLADWQIATATQVYAQKTLRQLSIINQEAVSALLERDAAQAVYDAAKKDTLTTPETLNLLKEQAASAKKYAKIATERRKSAAKINVAAEKAIARPAKDQRKQLPKTVASWQQLNNAAPVAEAPIEAANKRAKRPLLKPKRSAPDSTSLEQPPAVSEAPTDTDSTDNKVKIKKTKTKTPAAPKHARYKVEEDVLITPPTANCNMAVERRDGFSGAIYRETPATEIFRFTNEYMRKTIPEGQSHITCHAAIANDGANGATLLLTFTIRDASARRAFGGLPKQSKANLRFLDGQVIWLDNAKNSDGDLQPDQVTVVFKGQYPLEKTTLKRLATNELDQIRIAWGSGFEDYNVQQVHVLMEMAQCLLK
jgi:hypothetical protein